MFTAPSHGSPTSSAPVTHTAPLAALRDTLPEPLREAMRRLSSTPGIHLDLQRQIIQNGLSAGTATDDGCSATCGSTCCD
jgi:hypothetical protein